MGLNPITALLVGGGVFLAYRQMQKAKPKSLKPENKLPVPPGPLPPELPPQPSPQGPTGVVTEPDIAFAPGGQTFIKQTAPTLFTVKFPVGQYFVAQESGLTTVVNRTDGSLTFSTPSRLPAGGVDQVFVMRIPSGVPGGEVDAQHKITLIGQ